MLTANVVEQGKWGWRWKDSTQAAKKCKWGDEFGGLAAVHWGLPLSILPGVFLLLSRFPYCLASKPYCIACRGNSVSWAFSPSYWFLLPPPVSLSEPSSPSSLLSSRFSPDHLLLFVDPFAFYAPEQIKKREAPRRGVCYFFLSVSFFYY